uniref:Uncharacterized protein n=1 Tax=Anguilla anguilla TaxID=7936 RepID=A0A0E9XFY7_ANGAN
MLLNCLYVDWQEDVALPYLMSRLCFS